MGRCCVSSLNRSLPLHSGNESNTYTKWNRNIFMLKIQFSHTWSSDCSACMYLFQHVCFLRAHIYKNVLIWHELQNCLNDICCGEFKLESFGYIHILEFSAIASVFQIIFLCTHGATSAAFTNYDFISSLPDIADKMTIINGKMSSLSLKRIRLARPDLTSYPVCKSSWSNILSLRHNKNMAAFRRTHFRQPMRIQLTLVTKR